jgi:tail-anchored protein insertion receptor
MFWLPAGWFPYYVEWVLSFPRAPLGSVSIVSWQTACTGVVLFLSDIIKTALRFVLKPKTAHKQATKANAERETSSAEKSEKNS